MRWPLRGTCLDTPPVCQKIVFKKVILSNFGTPLLLSLAYVEQMPNYESALELSWVLIYIMMFMIYKAPKFNISAFLQVL